MPVEHWLTGYFANLLKSNNSKKKKKITIMIKNIIEEIIGCSPEGGILDGCTAACSQEGDS